MAPDTVEDFDPDCVSPEEFVEGALVSIWPFMSAKGLDALIFEIEGDFAFIVTQEGKIIKVHRDSLYKLGRAKHMFMPRVKKVVPTLFINDIVSVQPMSVPSGRVFYMDTEYGKQTTLGNLVTTD